MAGRAAQWLVDESTGSGQRHRRGHLNPLCKQHSVASGGSLPWPSRAECDEAASAAAHRLLTGPLRDGTNLSGSGPRRRVGRRPLIADGPTRRIDLTSERFQGCGLPGSCFAALGRQPLDGTTVPG